MNETKTLTFSPFEGVEHTLKTVVVDGVMWWVAIDVFRVLGVSGCHSAMRDFPDTERGLHSMKTPGGPQTLKCVNREGLIRLIMRSRKPIAREFQDWAVKVLDTTIETGSYIMGEEKLTQPNLTMSELEQVQEQLAALLAKKVSLLEKAMCLDDKLTQRFVHLKKQAKLREVENEHHQEADTAGPSHSVPTLVCGRCGNHPPGERW